ncbi:ABC-2 transporter permease [Allokutzneria albata]|uniref:ABC-2 family transporter protein n=1 Tax=Allokutzneria albata TaxID=211114 RepID=A0A1H0BK92_ALLAB|nr:ABC transporter permease subunit [Allokutzneria albata]SDN46052.1 ABC-2 family transporter protein [Allokutzneria albata]
MNGLVKAEFRKIFSTNLWWGMLIPGALITLAFAAGGAWIGSLGVDIQDIDQQVPLALPMFASGMTFGTLFAALVGVIGVTGEYRHRTITTTYLTAGSRDSVLVAKLIAYAALGGVYGVAAAVFGSIGAVLGSGGEGFPSAVSWLAICAVGIVSSVLWALFGVGLGALVGNQLGAVLGLLLYTQLVEGALSALLRAQGAEEVPPFLPYTAGNDMTMDLALNLFFGDLPGRLTDSPLVAPLRQALTEGAPIWWASALIFLGYTLLVVFAGSAVSKQRDIT